MLIKFNQKKGKALSLLEKISSGYRTKYVVVFIGSLLSVFLWVLPWIHEQGISNTVVFIRGYLIP